MVGIKFIFTSSSPSLALSPLSSWNLSWNRSSPCSCLDLVEEEGEGAPNDISWDVEMEWT